MIYFSNTNPQIPHLTFIGRWSPFHAGHTGIIQKKQKDHPDLPVLIMVRDNPGEQYSAQVRAEYIKQWMVKHKVIGTIMVIPNIQGVYWGRGVGYETGYVEIPEKLQQVSGTSIRKSIHSNSPNWKSLVANKSSASMLSPKISNIITRGAVIWLTGCPSSGKTTISNMLTKKISQRYPYLKIQTLDGDQMRSSPLAQGVGFSPSDRAQHIRRMGHMAKMFADHGICVICAFVSPERSIRNQIRKSIGKDRFFEIYVHASKKIRIKRDVKGMYKEAIQGTLKGLTGFDAPYEPPVEPSVRCNTEKETVSESVTKILSTVFE